MSKELENILIAKQIRPTPMRVLVLEYLLKQNAAAGLYDLEQEFERSDRVTLYRTLKTFEEKGLVHNIKDGSDAVKYALCQDGCEAGIHNDLHLHFYCSVCKNLFCLPKIQMPEVRLPEGYQLKELSLVARGVCGSCRS